MVKVIKTRPELNIQATRTKKLAGGVNKAPAGVQNCKTFSALNSTYIGNKDSNMINPDN